MEDFRLPKPHLLFYGNSSASLGSGHIMRMLAIASWANTSDWQISFCGKYCHQVMINKLAGFGFPFTYLHNILTAEQIEELKPDALIIDDYFLTDDEWREIEKLHCLKVALDDNLATHFLPVDIVINPSANDLMNVYRSRSSNATLLLGSDYAYLRTEFSLNTPVEYINRQQILITLGGADVKNMALPLASSFCQLFPQQAITLLLGSLNHKKIDALMELSTTYPNFHLITQCENVAEQMGKTMIAVSAAGSTLNELATMGVPTLALVCVDNQIGALHSPHRNTWYQAIDVRSYGRGHVSEDGQILDNVAYQMRSLLEDIKRRQHMHKTALECIDGRGCSRILSQIKL